jgi:hypothetical protein
MRTINDLINSLKNISKEDREKEFSIVKEPNVGLYLCSKEGKGKVRVQMELVDLSEDGGLDNG